MGFLAIWAVSQWTEDVSRSFSLSLLSEQILQKSFKSKEGEDRDSLQGVCLWWTNQQDLILGALAAQHKAHADTSWLLIQCVLAETKRTESKLTQTPSASSPSLR